MSYELVGATTVRVGKPIRALDINGKEGVSITVWHDFGPDSIPLATAYGEYEGEARTHANLIAHALGEHFGAKVRP